MARRKARRGLRLLMPAGIAVAVVLPVAVVLLLEAVGWWRLPRADPGPDPWDVTALVPPIREPPPPADWKVHPVPPPPADLPATVRLPGIIRDVTLVPGDPGVYVGQSWPASSGGPSKKFADRETVTGRFDRRTGEPVGEAWAVGQEGVGRMTLAVSRTGAVARKEWSKPAVTVYPAGGGSGREVALPPAGPGEPHGRWAGWLGWADDGTLLVIDRGRLTGWDAAGVRKFQANGAADPPAALDPAGRWLIARPGDHLEARAADSGAVLGRVGGEGSWEWAIVSLDGRRFAASRRPAGGRAEVHVWDAATGRRLAVVPHGPIPWPDPPPGVGRRDEAEVGTAVRWVGPHLLVVGDEEAVKLIDLEAKLYTAVVWLPPVGKAVRTSPDGRFRLVGAEAAPVVELPNAGRPAFAPGQRVRAEAATGGPDRDRQLVELVAALLAREGYAPGGEGDWTLRLAGNTTTAGNLSYGWTTGPSVPVASAWFELYDPAGRKVWFGAAQQLSFLGVMPNKYVDEQKTKADPHKMTVTTTTRFDFGGRDPETAMTELAWRTLAAKLAAQTPTWPRAAWRTPAGEYQFPPFRFDLPAGRK